MKRIALLFVLAVLGVCVHAQTYDKVKNAVLLKKLDEARTELNKILSDPKLKEKDKTEGIYWTFAVNSLSFGDDALAAKYPGSDSAAFTALYQYEQKDTALKALRENDAIAPAIETIRITGFNNGVKAFNNHNPQDAYKSFGISLKADEFMSRHNFLPKNFVDTSIVLYAGYAAQNNGDVPAAVSYYTKLIDKNIHVDAKDFSGSIYNVVLNYYASHNDQENFKKYADIIKAQVPAYSAQVDQISMQNLTANTALPDLIAKYKENTNLTEQQLVTYAEAFAQPDKDELSKLDSTKQANLKLIAADAFSKAYNAAINASPKPAEDNTGLYSYNAGILYYGLYQDLDQRFYNLRGGDAALKAQRDVVEKSEHVYSDSSAIWFTNAYNIFKAKTDLSKREKSLLLNTVKNLANIYQWKEDKAKGINPKDYDKYDALYKQFDAETDKYSK